MIAARDTAGHLLRPGRNVHCPGDRRFQPRVPFSVIPPEYIVCPIDSLSYSQDISQGFRAFLFTEDDSTEGRNSIDLIGKERFEGSR